jgi:hypothetical protein
MNLLFSAALHDVYAFLTMEAYLDAIAPFLPKVPNVPDYTTCVDNNDRATVRAMQAQNKKTLADIVTMNSALANVFLEAMLSQLRASSQQQRLRKPNIVFVYLFLWFINHTVRQRPRVVRQTGSAWPPIGTPSMGLIPSSSASSWCCVHQQCGLQDEQRRHHRHWPPHHQAMQDVQ